MIGKLTENYRDLKKMISPPPGLVNEIGILGVL